MSNGKLVLPLILIFVLAGCQSLTIRDIDTLPPSASLPEVSEPGWVDLRYFDNVPGIKLSDVEGLARFPDNPDVVEKLTQLEVRSSRADNYATLVRGYIEPPVTGVYRFYVSGDDETNFSLSSDRSAANATVVASVPSYSSVQQFDKFSSQASPQIELTAGKLYYFELRHKEGIGGDHFSVAWDGPGFSRAIIGSSYLHSPAQASEQYAPDETGIEGFEQGYRVGYFDGKQGLSFNDQYPPLDEDQDGLYDNWEVQAGLSPSNPGDADSDLDNDLLTARDEYEIWTNPAVSDTDGDGIPDGAEFAFGLDPRDSADAALDLDGDGYSNLEEYEASTAIDDPEDKPVQQVESPDFVAGLKGQFFSGRQFDTFVFSRMDQNVDNDWGADSPGSGIPNNNFSARWYTYIVPPHSSGAREYELRATRDDSVRVKIGDELVIDSWTGGSGETYRGQVVLSADTVYPTVVEFSEGYGSAFLRLEIVDLETQEAVEPSEVFRVTAFESSVSADTDEDGIPDTWEMEYGSDPFTNDAAQEYNDSGVSVAEAYQSDVNPWSLEPVKSWDGSISSETAVLPSEPETAPPEPEPSPEPAPATQVATLSWTAPGTRADGSSIALSEIGSYRINYGTSPNSLGQNVSVSAGTTEYSFENLEPGTWYFSVQVIDMNGLISAPSEVVSISLE